MMDHGQLSFSLGRSAAYLLLPLLLSPVSLPAGLSPVLIAVATGVLPIASFVVAWAAVIAGGCALGEGYGNRGAAGCGVALGALIIVPTLLLRIVRLL